MMDSLDNEAHLDTRINKIVSIFQKHEDKARSPMIGQGSLQNIPDYVEGERPFRIVFRLRQGGRRKKAGKPRGYADATFAQLLGEALEEAMEIGVLGSSNHTPAVSDHEHPPTIYQRGTVELDLEDVPAPVLDPGGANLIRQLWGKELAGRYNCHCSIYLYAEAGERPLRWQRKPQSRKAVPHDRLCVYGGRIASVLDHLCSFPVAELSPVCVSAFDDT